MRLKFQLIFYLTVVTVWRPTSSIIYKPNHHWNKGEYDFIVVGGGTAGCVVAGRLAENGKHSVLLVDSGGEPHPDMDIPAYVGKFLDDKNYVKIRPSLKQNNAALANNGIINLLRGQTLGGTAAVGSMVLNRGSPKDYDNWARLVDDDDWGYEELLKYFKKYEHYTIVTKLYSEERGLEGPITVSRSTYAPGRAAILQAAAELNFGITNANGPQKLGFSRMEYTQKNGRRMNSYKGYIQPLLINGTLKSIKGNLHILTHSEVNKIVFENGAAIGVEFSPGNEKNRVTRARAYKEVIVCAGAMGSPLLLMRSGVGIREDLEKAKIPVVKELPVGMNLQDHVFISLPVILGNHSASFDPFTDLNPKAMQQYQETGEGPYSASGGHAAQAFLTSENLRQTKNDLGWPDLHLMFMHRLGPILNTGFSQDVSAELEPHEVSVKWLVSLARTKTTGYIKVNPLDIYGDPWIDLNFLNNEEDMNVILKGLKFAREMCENTPTFQDLGCRVPTIPLKECKQFKYPDSDEYWKCFVHHLCSTGYHYSGTCKMGKKHDDPTAVVDPELKVIGLHNLRVIDASIMPDIVNANTQGTVYAIAEKGADMILHETEAGYYIE